MSALLEEPLASWDLIENEIAPRLSFLSFISLSKTCSRLNKSLPVLIKSVPTRLEGRVTDDVLARFSGLTSLVVVSEHVKVSDRGLRHLNHLTHLTYTYSLATIPDGLASLPRLTSLELVNSVTPPLFTTLTSLERLCLSNVYMKAQDLSQMRGLKKLFVLGTSTVDNLFNAFSSPCLTRLEHLRLSTCPYQTLVHANTLTRLDVVGLRYGMTEPVDDVALLTNLRTLKFERNSQLTDTSLRNLTSLTKLSLPGAFFYRTMAPLTAAFLSAQSHLLTLIIPDNTVVSDDVIAHLTSLTKLDVSHLNLNRTETVTRSNRGHVLITDRSLSRFTNLKTLKLTGNPVITDDAVSLLVNLTDLDLTDNKRISDESISNLTALRRLNLAGTTDVTDRALTRLQQLTWLSIARTKTLGKDFANLGNLETLIVHDAKLPSDASLAPLKNLTDLDLSWPTSKILTTPPNKVTAAAVINFKRLERLDLTRNGVITPETIRELGVSTSQMWIVNRMF